MIQHNILIRQLSPFMKLDLYAKGNDNYEVRSVYFDSPSLRSFYENMGGIKHRVKLRIRYYPTFYKNKEKEFVFIELKKKINDNIVKSRIVVPFDKAFKIINNSHQEAEIFYKNASKEDRANLEEIWYLYNRFCLKPVSVICYKREPYIDKMENRFRITFDTNIKVRNYNFDLHNEEGNKYIVPLHVCIMEVKFNNFIPNWAIKILNRNNVMRQKMSKFAKGLDRELIFSII